MERQRDALGAVVVGTGFGCLTHVRALQAAGFRVQALVGRKPDRTRERAARFEIPHALVSLADALLLPGIDVVSVATPPHTHRDLVLEAVAAGRHVVCEKPFAADADEARQMRDAADAAGVIHLLGTEFRFATGQALLTRTVRAGAIGEPKLATFLLDMPLLAEPGAELPDWWSDAAQGGGWLGAHGSHVIDQIRVNPGRVQWRQRHLGQRGPPADDGRGQLHGPFPPGVGGRGVHGELGGGVGSTAGRGASGGHDGHGVGRR